ncbi:MAG: HAMP domain-containing histidine kinase [Oscillospiraceae bacterium]|nr:HAMP domain-containing histidine kinase [Oscillospiraceae bacterium]
MPKVKGIRRRWMTNSIGVVLFVILFAITAFSVSLGGYYYATLSNGLQTKAEYVVEFFREYSTQNEYYQHVVTYVNNNYEGKDKVEMQFLGANGTIRFSTFGLAAYSSPGTPDIAGALDPEEPKTTPWTGTDPSTGEHIMAVTVPVLFDGRAVAAVRYVTSLRLVDRQMILVISITAAVGLVILMLVYFSNLYFVKSIVEPVAGITEITKRIAGGSYGIQIEKQHDDEIGDLTDAINDMSTQIDQAEKLKSEFISSVSHELRTPLTAINGWAETIQRGEVRDAEDVRKGMGIIVSEAKRLTNMVEELLEFSRIEDGRFTLSVEPVDLKAEFEDAVYTYREFFRKDGIELTYKDDEEEFPPVDADPERLRQVFCNLMDNAAKHGGSGGRIDCAIRREEEWGVITIRDYGPGVPVDELPHLKTKFYKGSSKARGSGIGLAVCDEIVGRHGGELLIDNAEGGGCLVTVRLPVGLPTVNGT